MTHTLQETLLFQLHHCINLMNRMRHRQEPGVEGMNPGQSRIIAIVSQQEGISQKELADLMQIRPASLSELLGKLENEGLIEKRTNETDRRIANLFLTPQSQQLVDKIRQARKQMSENLFCEFPQEDQEKLSSLLGQLIESMESKMSPNTENDPHERNPRSGFPGRPGDFSEREHRGGFR